MDYSTDEEFQFSVVCEQCKKIWKSQKIPFSKAHILPETEEKKIIYDVLYQREKESAKARALMEAQRVFNLCPICNKWVCDGCFMICEDLDMCKECAAKLKEKGNIVNGENTDSRDAEFRK